MIAPGEDNVSGLSDRFVSCGRKHVLMITNHGVHEWRVVPGLPDTGGQNVYVNQFTEALVAQGYRVTIVNRGGYPHPKTGIPQKGVAYHPGGYARIVYVEDGRAEFVRKEDMWEQLPALAADLRRKLDRDGDSYDLIISHYWDAGILGVRLNDSTQRGVPHVWVPHSLGALKKRNMDPSTWAGLRIDERIAHEKELIRHIQGAVATSTAIRDTFREDYGYEAEYFLPPCIDDDRYRPLPAEEVEPIWAFLASRSPLSVEEIKQRKIVTEISRTDATKRKDVLLQAFARAKVRVPNILLLVAIDSHAGELAEALLAMIRESNLEQDVIHLGSVWDQLPLLYNVTSVYCTPSVMEGFGMSAQEAAATGKPVVASNLVPFVCEYLIGPEPQRVRLDPQDAGRELLFGQGGIVVPADDVDGFADALVRLLCDDERREQMGRRALEITIPYFTWRQMTKNLMANLGV